MDRVKRSGKPNGNNDAKTLLVSCEHYLSQCRYVKSTTFDCNPQFAYLVASSRTSNFLSQWYGCVNS